MRRSARHTRAPSNPPKLAVLAALRREIAALRLARGAARLQPRDTPSMNHPRLALAALLALFALACWIEECDDSSGHSCTAQERTR